MGVPYNFSDATSSRITVVADYTQISGNVSKASWKSALESSKIKEKETKEGIAPVTEELATKRMYPAWGCHCVSMRRSYPINTARKVCRQATICVGIIVLMQDAWRRAIVAQKVNMDS